MEEKVIDRARVLKWRLRERKARKYLRIWEICYKNVPEFEEMIYWVLDRGLHEREDAPEMNVDYGIGAALKWDVEECEEAADAWMEGEDLGYEYMPDSDYIKDDADINSPDINSKEESKVKDIETRKAMLKRGFCPTIDQR